MHDASAKIPSGILNGNLNQLGDFDQCLDVTAPNEAFSGQYCLARVQLRVSDRLPRMKRLQKLIQAHDAFVNDIDDVSISNAFIVKYIKQTTQMYSLHSRLCESFFGYDVLSFRSRGWVSTPTRVICSELYFTRTHPSNSYSFNERHLVMHASNWMRKLSV